MKPILAQTSIDISAPLERVWRVVTGLERYPEWNPFIVRVDGEPAPGNRLRLHLRWADGRVGRSDEIITVLAPPAAGRPAVFAYRFIGGLARFGLVRAERFQRLTALPDGGTHYETVEVFHGLLARFVPLRAVTDGFERQARGLKKFAETG